MRIHSSGDYQDLHFSSQSIFCQESQRGFYYTTFLKFNTTELKDEQKAQPDNCKGGILGLPNNYYQPCGNILRLLLTLIPGQSDLLKVLCGQVLLQPVFIFTDSHQSASTSVNLVVLPLKVPCLGHKDHRKSLFTSCSYNSQKLKTLKREKRFYSH